MRVSLVSIAGHLFIHSTFRVLLFISGSTRKCGNVGKKMPRCKISVNPGWLKMVWQSRCFMPITSNHFCCCQLKNKNYSKGPKKNRKICLKKELCSATMAAHVLASVILVAVVLFPGPSPCSKMIRFTGMSKWVILFIHCSCLAPNKTRRIKAAESQQEAKRGE